MKKWVTLCALGILIFAGIFTAFSLAELPPTYDGTAAAVSVYELLEDPEAADESGADGAAAVIVQQNLEKTHSVNDVTSIVFDFRGYDTMGEAFILMLTVCGAIVLLQKTAKEKEEMRVEREQKKATRLRRLSVEHAMKLKSEQRADKPNLRVLRVIQRCGGDCILPLCIVYIFYVILHGHLSPGGGFQGGVLAVAAVILIYLGHGYTELKRAFCPNLLRPLEGVALVAYIAIAFAGVLAGINFCGNFAFMNGEIGALISSGTISWMDEAVAFNVVTGTVVLSIGMLSVLYPKDIDNDKDK